MMISREYYHVRSFFVNSRLSLYLFSFYTVFLLGLRVVIIIILFYMLLLLMVGKIYFRQVMVRKANAVTLCRRGIEIRMGESNVKICILV